MKKQLAHWALLTLCTLITGTALAQADAITGKIIHVEDGDSVTMLLPDNQHLKIRILGIDAPETCHSKNDTSCKKRPGQPFGRAAQDSLAKKIQGQTVIATCPSKDRYGRSVCRLFESQQDIGLSLIAEGVAWHYTKYDNTLAYAQAQQKAQNNRWGIWGAPQPIEPSQWRKRCWIDQDCPQ